ncbi:transmembrane protein 59 [Caerostris extrusa]|uniref:Transmembrane protein 59 n=1 Tax=Caerostris extrusa TaxID=172846 RepID=A0AAV4XWL0_CAEEX|nr:transmembrane protein 59 [Caerostris extrusa]
MLVHKHLLPITVLIFFAVQFISCAVLETLLNEASTCETQCEQNFSVSSLDLKKSCSEGCRLYTVIRLAKDLRDSNKTVKLCESACTEAFTNESFANACSFGCNAYPATKNSEGETQTLHLLTPLMYVRSAYNSMAHHVKQFISTSWTVYVQEDSAKMVILQTSPKVVESIEYSVSRDDGNSLKDYQQGWQEAKLDWMDCISHQSGIPRWLLVVVLFGFIFALLWLCCATAVTAPNHYLSTSKKKDMGYILVCEPNNEIKAPIVPLIEVNEEAPPLPPKVSLI